MSQNSESTIEAPTKLKAKDRRRAQQELTLLNKRIQGRGEDIPVQKGYKRTKMKFV